MHEYMSIEGPRPAAVGVPGYSETLPCVPESVFRARLLTSAALHVWGLEELADAGVLIASELVTNVLDHTRCRRLRVSARRVKPGTVRIAVSDRSLRVPELRAPGSGSPGGRGLLLVDALSHGWGCERRGWGKVVWARVCVGGGGVCP
jgi:hypothetical protein